MRKLKVIILISIFSVPLLFSNEDKNFNFSTGTSISNMIFDNHLGESDLLYDLMYHIDLSLGHNFKIKNSENISIRTDFTVIPFRAFSDLSLSLAYNYNNHQVSIGPSIVYDAYFPILRIYNVFYSFLIGDETITQEYWVYAGIVGAYRYKFDNNVGLYVKYKQSLINLSSMFLDVLYKPIDSYSFVSVGLIIYF